MRLEYHPLAASDLNEAASHYDGLQVGLGEAPREEVYAAIDRIALSPRGFQAIVSGIRRCVVHRFPYSVLFRLVDDETVRILAIRHHRRRPSLALHRR